MKTETVNAENSIGPSFELLQGESLFVPFGDFQHKMGLQRFDASAAERMAASLHGLGGRLRRLVTAGRRGVPIYIGHPDVPGRGAEFPDKRAYGWITEIAVENDGMRLGVRWTSAGRQMLEDGEFLYYSPYWEAEQEGRLLRPVELISVGLTNNPNIPVPPLANDGGDEPGTETDQPEPEPDTVMKKKLAEMLGKDETDSDEDLLAEVQRLLEATAENDDPDPDEDADTKPDPDADPDPDEEEEEAAAENDRLIGSIRAERVGMALDTLCLAGQLSVADRPAAATRLSACANDADFAAALESLRTASPALKTRPETDDLAGRGGAVKAENDLAAIRQRRSELMDAEMKANGGNFTPAWNKLARKHPDLFT